MSELARLSALIIETNPGMRTQLRNMLADFGINNVHLAVSAGAAVRTLREARFDIILCEYHLGTGQDGQHLLEDLRLHEVIPLETLFLMVTGERQYERVVSAAELVPNDYILKPFAADTLRVRLERALDEREAFLPAYRAISQGDLAEAIARCATGAAQRAHYRVDFMRLRAELLLRIGRADEAQTLYRQILDVRSLPWARLGLAKTYCMQRDYATAEGILAPLVDECEQFMEAYDWLARAREGGGKPKAARDALNAAATISPHRITRLRKLGELSLSLGDGEAAERIISEVVRKGKYSDFRDPEDHVRLVQAQISNKHFDEASATIRDLEKSMAGLPKTQLCSALSSALVHSGSGNTDRAREVLQNAIDKHGIANTDLSLDLRQELVKACFDNQLEAQGQQMVLDILRNAADDQTIQSTREILRTRGRAQLSEELEQRTHQEVKQLIATGAAKAQAGDFDGAVAEMLAAVRKMPGNTHVLFNAALALLRHIEHKGWNERFAAQARALIERVRKQDPGNIRLPALGEFLHLLIQRHRGANEQAQVPLP